MITLIGKKLAKKGLIFKHCGPVNECESCRFKGTCIDALEKGRMYIIRDVKGSEQKCRVHEENKVKVVEVDKLDITALIDSKRAFEGSMILFEPPECGEEACELKELCFPEGLYRDDKCQILKTLGKSDKKCPKGYALSKVILKI